MKRVRLAVCISIYLSFTDLALSAPEERESLAIETIYVTAQKRTEDLGEVPVSISVVNAELIDLLGIQELRDLSAHLPNMTMTQGLDAGSTIMIRGVGAHSRNLGFDSRVGVYLDGVYLGQSPALNQNLIDLDRIEVQRGPQGTLFGKNAVAGTINLISNKPSSDASASFTANAYNYNGTEFIGIVNLPVNKIISARLSATEQKSDGYIRNVWKADDIPTTGNFDISGPPFVNLPFCDSLGASTPSGCAAANPAPSVAPNTSKKLNGKNSHSYRAQLNIQANEKLNVNIALDGLQSDRSVMLGEPLTDTFGSTIDRFAPERYEVSFSEDSWEKRHLTGQSVTATYDFDNEYRLKSISAYRHTKYRFHNDNDASALDFIYVNSRVTYKQTTQEIQLSSPDHMRIKYVLGMYYYDQDARSAGEAVSRNAGWRLGMAPGDGASNSAMVETKSLALFLNSTYDINQQWRLGLGMRFSDETKDILYHLDGTRSGPFNTGTTPPGGYKNTGHYKNFSPALRLMYSPNDNTNFYSSYSTGFKSGGFNLDFVKQADLDDGISFDVETVSSYELGVKSNFLSNRLRINSAIFVSTYDDYQVNQFFDLGFDPNTGTQMTSIRITNAAEVDISGLELEAWFRVTNSLSLNASVGLLDATFGDFPGGLSVDVAGSNIPGGEKESVNAAGNRLRLAPEVSATIGVQYYLRFPILAAEVLFHLDAVHTGDYYTSTDNESSRTLSGTHPALFTFDPGSYNIPNTIDYGHVDAITTFNGRIGLIADNETWKAFLWARNITNKNDYINYGRGFFGTLSGTPIEPRTVGLEFSYYF